ncbi:myelin transcription factor 1 [Rhodamnia argentea]|uniref:Myelin transcription factor 1 n=1 Tax=Rhodamnia argentea TaxID=178133 RepID=A0A8B8QYY3_9MYRT|nr:myelin transcription factor 1 [Rhodamnia argentea]
MAKPTLDLIQNPQKFRNSKERKRRAKGMSFLAFVFSVFFYISIFYIFNLSPSQNFKNSKFWFFISNTLILIIAADYGSFSSSGKGRRDLLYEEYLARTSLVKDNSGGRFIPAVPHDPETIQENVSVVEEEKRVVSEETRAAADEREPEKEPCLKESQEEEEEEEEEEEVAKNGPQDDEAEKQVEVNGEAASETEKASEGTIAEENDEFSRMSDEELNRRVEEFIWKLKRQIQLQEVKEEGIFEKEEGKEV